VFPVWFSTILPKVSYVKAILLLFRRNFSFFQVVIEAASIAVRLWLVNASIGMIAFCCDDDNRRRSEVRTSDCMSQDELHLLPKRDDQ
jgi:hypothetical protein